MIYRENRKNPERSRRVNDHTRCVKQKLGAVVDSAPPDNGCVVLDGELTHD